MEGKIGPAAAWLQNCTIPAGLLASPNCSVDKGKAYTLPADFCLPKESAGLYEGGGILRGQRFPPEHRWEPSVPMGGVQRHRPLPVSDYSPGTLQQGLDIQFCLFLTPRSDLPGQKVLQLCIGALYLELTLTADAGPDGAPLSKLD